MPIKVWTCTDERALTQLIMLIILQCFNSLAARGLHDYRCPSLDWLAAFYYNVKVTLPLIDVPQCITLANSSS
ncbi:uncharacterized protein BDZ83DRAFT_618531 [Colletotrichum acutatum]|uniref:Uncharacterized protein n=1 Tax=Glomerella acutata TaxID=27357 RepID=A0AAD8UK36_GLOAC|nr:uncharacterized protein BDZ83DRAFT_618531 [Colletotrichum acutatum]KAK1725807.1 hypothetical protein BDZ83DRAFT_618531 [Colletotrichum acutatum]